MDPKKSGILGAFNQTNCKTGLSVLLRVLLIFSCSLVFLFELFCFSVSIFQTNVFIFTVDSMMSAAVVI